MRTTKGAARNQAKKRLFKKTKGFRGGQSPAAPHGQGIAGPRRCLRLPRSPGAQRKFRELWIIRLNAAARKRELRYSEFIHGLHLAGIELDRKSLSEMAIHDPAGFDTIVERVKQELAKLRWPEPIHS